MGGDDLSLLVMGVNPFSRKYSLCPDREPCVCCFLGLCLFSSMGLRVEMDFTASMEIPMSGRDVA